MSVAPLKTGLNAELLIAGIAPSRLAGHAAPALAALLWRAAPLARAPGDAEAWLCDRLGIAHAAGAPLAPLAALADGLDAARGYWLRVAPLHLLLQRDRLVATVAADAWLDAGSAAQLVAALNAHFGEAGMRFYAPQPTRWYLCLAQPPQLVTTPLTGVLGRDVAAHLPRGADALDWHRWMNEVQMLLHEHPCNRAAEAAGRAPVNSLWVWGGGALPAARSGPLPALQADLDWLQGADRAGLAAVSPLPVDFDSWRHNGGAPALAVLDVQADAARHDADACAAALARLQRDWLAPLAQALRRRQLAQVVLHLAGERAVASFLLQPADRWKFWRRGARPEDALG